MKKYLKIILIPTISLLVAPFIYSIINLFKLEIPPFIYLITSFIITFITGIFLGLITEEKAYLKGLGIGFIIVLTMFTLSLIFKANHSLFNIIYYLIIIATTTLGAMIGVNKKKG